MGRTGFLTALLLLLLPLLPSEPIEVTASVNATRIGIGDTLVLTLTFKGIQEFGTPELSRLYDFRILQNSQRFASQTFNNVTSTSIEYTYTLAPLKTGALIIPTFTFRIAGQDYRTQPFQITVVKGRMNPQPPAQQRPASPFDWDDSFSPFGRNAPEKVAIFLKTSLSKKTVLVGEQVIFRIILYKVNPIGPPVLISKQSLAGFFWEWFPVPQQISGRRETEGGITYEVFEIRRAAIFPTQPGSQVIPALSFQFQLGDPMAMFFASNPVTRATPETPIQVESLAPDQANLPVGKFTFKVQADKSRTDINELVSLKITVSGTGNTKALAPPLPTSSESFIAYPPKITRDAVYEQDYLYGTVTVEVPLAMEKTGQVAIPPLQFTHVDPDTRKTVALSSQPITIDVSGQKKVSDKAASVEQSGIIQKGEDILFIAGGRIANQMQPLSGKRWVLALVLLPFVINVVFIGKLVVWDRLVAQSPLLQGRRRLTRTLSRLSQIGQHAEIAAVLEDYLSWRSGIGLFELSKLRAKGIAAESVDKLLVIKASSEYSKYSPQKKSFRELKQDIEELKSLIRQMDKKLQ